MQPLRLRGFAASAGIAIAPARVLGDEAGRRHYARIDEDGVAVELERFDDALQQSRAEIETAKEQLTEQQGAEYA